MSKHFFDYNDGDYVHSVSDNMAMDSDGNMMMRMGDNMLWTWIPAIFTSFLPGLPTKKMTVKRSDGICL